MTTRGYWVTQGLSASARGGEMHEHSPHRVCVVTVDVGRSERIPAVRHHRTAKASINASTSSVPPASHLILLLLGPLPLKQDQVIDLPRQLVPELVEDVSCRLRVV